MAVRTAQELGKELADAVLAYDTQKKASPPTPEVCSELFEHILSIAREIITSK